MARRTAGALPMLIRLDAEGAQPLHYQLYEGLRSLILEGRLAPGTRLASSRMLATDLDVSRNTVINAFERLAAEGYLQGRAGGGTRVSSTLPEDLLKVRAPSTPQSAKPAHRHSSRRSAV